MNDEPYLFILSFELLLSMPCVLGDKTYFCTCEYKHTFIIEHLRRLLDKPGEMPYQPRNQRYMKGEIVENCCLWDKICVIDQKEGRAYHAGAEHRRKIA